MSARTEVRSRCGLCNSAAAVAAGRVCSPKTADEWARLCPSRHGKPELCGDPWPIAEPVDVLVLARVLHGVSAASEAALFWVVVALGEWTRRVEDGRL